MEFTIGKFLRLVVALFFIFVIGWLIYSLSNIVTIIIISALIAYILDPIASSLEAKGFGRATAAIIVFIVFIGGIILLGWMIFPTLFKELMTMQNNLTPDATDGFLTQIENFFHEQITFINIKELNLRAEINDFIANLTKQSLSFAADLVSVISAAVIIPFVTFFLLKDGRDMKKLLISYIPNRYFEMSLNIIHKMDLQLGGYLRGQFIEAFVVGSLAILALWILGIKYFIIIGVFAGFANFIPYIGPVAGAVPAILVAVGGGADSTLIIYIILAFAIIQLIDNVVMQPLVLSKSVNLHPLIIVLAVLVGGNFFGILGMFLAVPVAGILKVTSSECYQGVRKFNLS
ncbi:AI-2E family transporter [Calditrichota bacterium]